MREQNEFFNSFRGIHIRFSKFYVRILTQANLTLPQYVLLNQLSGSAAMPMTDVSERLFISKPAVTNLVDRLERNKFLKRIAHPNDRRVSLIEIQPKGDRVIRKIQSDVFRYLLEVLHEFKPSERKIILKFQARMAETLEKILLEPVKQKRRR